MIKGLSSLKFDCFFFEYDTSHSKKKQSNFTLDNPLINHFDKYTWGHSLKLDKNDFTLSYDNISSETK